MSASQMKRSWWSMFSGLFQRRAVTALRYLAPHLNSMGIEDAARLMGAGSVPPRKHALALAQSSLTMPAAAPVSPELPWPLFRSTGSYAADHALNSWALSVSASGLIDELASEGSEAQLTSPIVQAHRNLAAQLAVVSRLNQPKSRMARTMLAPSAAAKIATARQAKSNLAANNPAPSRAKTALSASPSHRAHTPPQSIVIDLAAAKKMHRADKAKRAA